MAATAAGETGFGDSPPALLVPFLAAVARWSHDPPEDTMPRGHPPSRPTPHGADLAVFLDAAEREVRRRFQRRPVPEVVELVGLLLARADDAGCGEAEREVLRPLILAGEREVFERVRDLVETDPATLTPEDLRRTLAGVGFLPRPVSRRAPGPDAGRVVRVPDPPSTPLVAAAPSGAQFFGGPAWRPG